MCRELAPLYYPRANLPFPCHGTCPGYRLCKGILISHVPFVRGRKDKRGQTSKIEVQTPVYSSGCVANAAESSERVSVSGWFPFAWIGSSYLYLFHFASTHAPSFWVLTPCVDSNKYIPFFWVQVHELERIPWSTTGKLRSEKWLWVRTNGTYFSGWIGSRSLGANRFGF